MMSRKKSRGVLCFRGGQDEGDVRGWDSVDGEKARKETELFKLMMEDFEKKLGRLMMSSERERQLMDQCRPSEREHGLKRGKQKAGYFEPRGGKTTDHG